MYVCVLTVSVRRSNCIIQDRRKGWMDFMHCVWIVIANSFARASVADETESMTVMVVEAKIESTSKTDGHIHIHTHLSVSLDLVVSETVARIRLKESPVRSFRMCGAVIANCFTRPATEMERWAKESQEENDGRRRRCCRLTNRCDSVRKGGRLLPSLSPSIDPFRCVNSYLRACKGRWKGRSSNSPIWPCSNFTPQLTKNRQLNTISIFFFFYLHKATKNRRNSTVMKRKWNEFGENGRKSRNVWMQRSSETDESMTVKNGDDDDVEIKDRK